MALCVFLAGFCAPAKHPHSIRTFLLKSVFWGLERDFLFDLGKRAPKTPSRTAQCGWVRLCAAKKKIFFFAQPTPKCEPTSDGQKQHGVQPARVVLGGGGGLGRSVAAAGVREESSHEVYFGNRQKCGSLYGCGEQGKNRKIKAAT